MKRSKPQRLSPGIIICLGVAAMPLAGCGPMTFVVGVAPGDQQLQATVVESDGRWLKDRVAIIDVTGLIHNSNKPGLIRTGENPVSVLHEKLEQARQDDMVKAVILRLNTPGGTVTASDAMYRIVQRFKDRSAKPVVVLMMDVAASGGTTSPAPVTGSSPTPRPSPEASACWCRPSAYSRRWDAWGSKPKRSPPATIRTPALCSEHSPTATGRSSAPWWTTFLGRFVDVVRQSRPMISESSFALITDGRILTGAQATQIGLIDQVGDVHDAFAVAKDLAGLQRADLVVYHRPLEYVGSPYAMAPSVESFSGRFNGSTQINLAQINLPPDLAGMSCGFFYLWQPQ